MAPSDGASARAPRVSAGMPDGQAEFAPWQFYLLAGMLGATAAVVVATGQPLASIVALSVTVLAASTVAMGVHRTLRPLVAPEAPDGPPLIGGRTRAAIEREKTLVLRSIKELEFDRAMGKVADADYQEMSGRLRARAMGLIRQLDAGTGYRDAIERELAERLGRVAPASGEPASRSAGAGQTPLAVAPGRSSGHAACASCGAVADPDARFCKHCGRRLTD